MKKFISPLLTFCLFLTLFSITVSASPSSFSDVPDNAWYADSVQFVSQKGLMGGVGSGKFAPNDNTTRGQLVTILYRLEGEPAISGGSPFSDVHSSDYFGKAVQWASANSIVSGVGGNRFAPNDSITREQMVTILYRYSKYKKYDMSKSISLARFKDFGQISEYALDAMRWSNASGLISGMNSTTVAPLSNTTRAEIAIILMRFCEKVVGTMDGGASKGIPLNFDYEGETVFTAYLPSHWEGNYTTEKFTWENGMSLDIYDKVNKDATEYDGRFMGFAIVSNISDMGNPNKRLLSRIQFNSKTFDVVLTGPTDVRFDYTNYYLTNSYKEKEMDIQKVAKSVEFSDSVVVLNDDNSVNNTAYSSFQAALMQHPNVAFEDFQNLVAECKGLRQTEPDIYVTPAAKENRPA